MTCEFDLEVLWLTLLEEWEGQGSFVVVLVNNGLGLAQDAQVCYLGPLPNSVYWSTAKGYGCVHGGQHKLNAYMACHHKQAHSISILGSHPIQQSILFYSQSNLWASASALTDRVPATQSLKREVGTVALWPQARACWVRVERGEKEWGLMVGWCGSEWVHSLIEFNSDWKYLCCEGGCVMVVVVVVFNWEEVWLWSSVFEFAMMNNQYAVEIAWSLVETLMLWTAGVSLLVLHTFLYTINNCGLLPANQPAACQPHNLQRERWDYRAMASSQGMLNEGKGKRKREGFDGWVVWRWVWWSVSSTVVNVSPSTRSSWLRSSQVCIKTGVFLRARPVCWCWDVMSNMDNEQVVQKEEWLWGWCCTAAISPMPGGTQHCVPYCTMRLSFFWIMGGTMYLQGMSFVIVESRRSQWVHLPVRRLTTTISLIASFLSHFLSVDTRWWVFFSCVCCVSQKLS